MWPKANIKEEGSEHPQLKTPTGLLSFWQLFSHFYHACHISLPLPVPALDSDSFLGPRNQRVISYSFSYSLLHRLRIAVTSPVTSKCRTSYTNCPRSVYYSLISCLYIGSIVRIKKSTGFWGKFSDLEIFHFLPPTSPLCDLCPFSKTITFFQT